MTWCCWLIKLRIDGRKFSFRVWGGFSLATEVAFKMPTTVTVCSREEIWQKQSFKILFGSHELETSGPQCNAIYGKRRHIQDFIVAKQMLPNNSRITVFISVISFTLWNLVLLLFDLFLLLLSCFLYVEREETEITRINLHPLSHYNILNRCLWGKCWERKKNGSWENNIYTKSKH